MIKKKRLVSLLFLFGLMAQAGESPNLFTPEFSTAGFYETNPSVRQAMYFNVGWRFFKGDPSGAHATDYDDRMWELVNLPDGMELLPLSASGGINYQGSLVVSKTVQSATCF